MPTQEEHTVLPRPDPMQIHSSQLLLGSGKECSISHLLGCYETKLWAMEENQEWSQSSFDEYTQAKNILLRELILSQLEKHGRFKITTNFENPCSRCHGSGEIYKFLRKSQKVRCMKCDNGKMKDGSKCITCKGKASLKTFAIVPQLRDTTICPFCRGKGFFKKHEYTNPAINEDVGKQLKKKFKDLPFGEEQLTPAKDLGQELKASNPEPDKVAPMILDPGQDKPIGEGCLQKIKQPSSD